MALTGNENLMGLTDSKYRRDQTVRYSLCVSPALRTIYIAAHGYRLDYTIVNWLHGYLATAVQFVVW